MDTCELEMAICNENDIKTYATSKLEALQIDLTWAHEISRRAEGVFLWAVLVVQRLKIAKEIIGEDMSDRKIIRKCLADKGLEKLFGKLISHAKALQGSNMRYYFRTAILHQSSLVLDSSIASLTAARSRGPVYNYEDFTRNCDVTVKQVIAQTSGLLHVQDIDYVGSSKPEVNVWMVPQSGTVTKDESWQDEHNIIANRYLSHMHSCVERLLKYRMTEIRWLHRSVYEYVLEHEDGTFGKAPTEFDKTIISGLLEGYFRLMIHGPDPDWTSHHNIDLHGITEHVFRYVCFIKSSSCFSEAEVASKLDDLRTCLHRFPFKEFRPCSVRWINDTSKFYNPPEAEPCDLPGNSYAMATFWRACVDGGAHDYIMTRGATLKSYPASHWLLVLLVDVLIRRWDPDRDRDRGSVKSMLVVFFLGCLESILKSWSANNQLPLRTCGTETILGYGNNIYKVLSITWQTQKPHDATMRSTIMLLVSAWLRLHYDLEDELQTPIRYLPLDFSRCECFNLSPGVWMNYSFALPQRTLKLVGRVS